MLKNIFSGSAQQAGKITNLYKPSTIKQHNWFWRIGLLVSTLSVIIIGLMLLWSREPATISANEAIGKYVQHSPANKKGSKPNTLKTGVATAAMTLHIIDSLTRKSGGYLRNDVSPPGLLMDNMPQWEYGVILNLRDLSTVFRDNFSVSGSQSTRDKDLANVENKLRLRTTQWMMPKPENYYHDAYKSMQSYLTRITDENDADAQFYARADNLQIFLMRASQGLGSYSQRLLESDGTKTTDLSLAGDANAKQSTDTPKQTYNKTAWYKLDDNFYEARGYTWALLQEMRAIQVDFKSVLKDKNATAYVEQIIRELEATQSTVWSPVILNGSGFGFIANHSKVMASHISQASNILNDLIKVLENG